MYYIFIPRRRRIHEPYCGDRIYGFWQDKSGETSVSDLGLTFVDVDKVIVKKMNMSVKEILQKFGEPYYRALETMTVKALIEDKERKVISLGRRSSGSGAE